MKKLLFLLVVPFTLYGAVQELRQDTQTHKVIKPPPSGAAAFDWDFSDGTTNITGGGGGGTPGGINLQLQFNNASTFGGVPYLTYNGAVVTQTAGARFNLIDPTDVTKKAILDLSAIPTAVSRTVTIAPGANSVTVTPLSGGANNFMTGINVSGAPVFAQPTFAGTAGTLSLSQTSMTSGKLLGRYIAGTGPIQEITLGANLTLNAFTGVLDATGSGGGGTPGGSNQQLQFNNSTAFGGISTLTYDTVSDTVTQVAGTKFNLADPANTARRIRFNIGNVSSGTTRIASFPDADSTTVVPQPPVANQFVTNITGIGGQTTAQVTFPMIGGTIAFSQNRILIGKEIWQDGINGSDATGARGDLAKPFLTITAALAAASAGDVVYAGPGTTNTGVNTILVPAGVTLAGAGADYTIITGATGLTRAVVEGGTSSAIVNLTIQNTASTGVPFGVGSSSAAFTSLFVSGCKIIGVSDGIYLNKAGTTGLRMENTIVQSQGDCFEDLTATSIVEFRNCDFISDGTATAATRGLNLSNGTARFYQGTITVGNSAGSNVGAFATGTGTAIELHGVRLANSGGGVDFDLFAQSSGDIGFDNVTRPDGGPLVTGGGGTVRNLERWDVKVTTQASGATWSPVTTNSDDIFKIAAQGVAATTINNPAGSPVDGAKLVFEIKDDGTSRALTWTGSQYRAAGGLTLPASTTTGQWNYYAFLWNATDSKWEYVGSASNAAGVTAFLALTDTPKTYVGQGGKAVRVNSGETALEFFSAAGTGTVTSVGLLGTSKQITVTGTSPITSSGSFTLSVPTNAEFDIAKLTGLTGNGFVKTSGGDGTLSVDTATYLTSTSISDTAYGASWDTVTTVAPSKNALYDYLHLIDTDDDGKVNVLDQVAGIVRTDVNGVIGTPILPPVGAIVGTTDIQTLSAKRINPRLTQITSNATWSPSADNDDIFAVSAQAVSVTTISNPSGTTSPGQSLLFRIKDDGTARPISGWGAQYEAGPGLALPTTTIAGQTDYFGFKWNGVTSKWTLLASSQTNVVSDTPYTSAWNAVIGIAPSKNAVYDWGHTFDSDDDGYVDHLDTIGAGGMIKTDATGLLSVATGGTDYVNLAFKSIDVSGQGSVVADTAADSLTLVAGSNVTITTNSTTDTITIASTGTGGGSTDDTAFPTGWNGATTVSPSQNAMYDYIHLIDTDDDGKINVLDLGAGLVKTDASGVVATAVVGTDYVTPTGTMTLTSKRITKRVVSVAAPGPTPAVNTDNTDVAKFTGVAANITSMTTSLTGSPVGGDQLRMDLTDDGTARTIAWGASFEAGAMPLPATTEAGVRLDLMFYWNTVTSKWRCMSTSAPVISDAAFDSSWNGVTGFTASKNALYDYLHIADTDDDGKINVLDQFSAGITNTDINGLIQPALTIPAGLLVGTSETQTLSGKRISKRVTTINSAFATPTINTDNADAVLITGISTAITNMSTNTTGAPTDFDSLIIRFKDDATPRAITWGTKYVASQTALPTTTVASKELTAGFIYSTARNAWVCVATDQEP